MIEQFFKTLPSSKRGAARRSFMADGAIKMEILDWLRRQPGMIVRADMGRDVLIIEDGDGFFHGHVNMNPAFYVRPCDMRRVFGFVPGDGARYDERMTDVLLTLRDLMNGERCEEVRPIIDCLYQNRGVIERWEAAQKGRAALGVKKRIDWK